MWCRSRRFDCILLVFFGRLGRLVMRDLIKHNARLHPNKINRDTGIEIWEAWVPTIKKNTTTGEACDSGPPKEANHWVNSKDRITKENERFRRRKWWHLAWNGCGKQIISELVTTFNISADRYRSCWRHSRGYAKKWKRVGNLRFKG